MDKKSSLRVLVTTKAGGLGGVIPKLRKSGMKIQSVLDTVGIVTGEIEAGKLDSLSKVPGVSVEEDKTVQLPSPDSPVQ